MTTSEYNLNIWEGLERAQLVEPDEHIAIIDHWLSLDDSDHLRGHFDESYQCTFLQPGESVEGPVWLVTHEDMQRISTLYPTKLFELQEECPEYDSCEITYAHNGTVYREESLVHEYVDVYDPVRFGRPDLRQTPPVDKWINVRNLRVHVYETDEGVVCDIWPAEADPPESIASTWATFNEAELDNLSSEEE